MAQDLDKERLNYAKNQHLIPEGLLEKFAVNHQVYEAFFSGDNSKIYKTNVGNSMCERFAYEHNELKKNVIENYFGKIETQVIPKISNVIEIIEDYKKGVHAFTAIKSVVEELLPVFVVFYYRSGALLLEFSSLNKEDKIPLLSQKILNQHYIESLAKTIRDGYQFAVLESADEFLLSDQYMSTAALKIKSNFFDISNRHIGLRETLILIPFSSKYYGIYWHTEQNPFPFKEGVINTLETDQVLLINQAIMNNSYTKCISKKRTSLEAVIGTYSMQYPSQAYAGYESGLTTGVIRKKEVFFYEVDKRAHRMLLPWRFTDYKDVRRNDICLCGSKKKFKKCCLPSYERLEPVMNSMKYDKGNLRKFVIPTANIVELPIDQWSGYSEKVRNSERRKSGISDQEKN